MATPTANFGEYCTVAVRSRLLTEAEVRQARSAWLAENPKGEADLEGFRKFLVKRGLLTEYQAALLQRGRAEGFFIGSYKILDRIGSGQSAGVYKAAHTTTGQLVALKVLPSSRSKDPHLLNRFMREGRLLTQLDHPNVVRAYQLGQSGTVHYIVMEHLEGETLDEVLTRRKKLAPDESVRVVYQALQGLEHVHGKSMVHRDLKPSNLMVCRTGGKSDTTLDATIKVLDIGLGREMFKDDSPATQDIQLTSEGAILGTPDYLAPEQARDARTADIRADIYSLGCVLYHLIVGHPPFPDKNVMSQMVRHATEKPAPVSQFVPTVPPGLVQVIELVLEKDPRKRPGSPAAAAELLKPFLPSKAAQAEKVKVLPAFQEWLESESALEMPQIKPGTNPSPVAPASPSLAPAPASARTAPPKAPTASVPKTATSPTLKAPEPEAIEVELFEMPEEPPPRSLLDWDRRDFLMLGSGAVGILMAIGFGYTLSRMLRRREPDTKDDGNEK